LTRDEILDLIEEMGLLDEEIILFDGMEDAFLGIAERFEPIEVKIATEDGVYEKTEIRGGTHRYFIVYSYTKMVESLVSTGMDAGDAEEYLEFNTVGLYAGPNTPAIMRDY
jgi:hypothetical protein